MSAAEIIEQIEALPAEEQARVFAFIRARESGTVANKEGVDESARAAGEWVIKNYGELLQKLAQ